MFHKPREYIYLLNKKIISKYIYSAKFEQQKNVLTTQTELILFSLTLNLGGSVPTAVYTWRPEDSLQKLVPGL